jgi:hypothetical protein
VTEYPLEASWGLTTFSWIYLQIILTICVLLHLQLSTIYTRIYVTFCLININVTRIPVTAQIAVQGLRPMLATAIFLGFVEHCFLFRVESFSLSDP